MHTYLSLSLFLSSLDEISTMLHFISHYTNSPGPARWLSFFFFSLADIRRVNFNNADWFSPERIILFFTFRDYPRWFTRVKERKRKKDNVSFNFSISRSSLDDHSSWLATVSFSDKCVDARYVSVSLISATVSVRTDDSHSVNLARKYCRATTNGYVGHEPVISRRGWTAVINTTECARGTTRLVININGASIGVITIK